MKKLCRLIAGMAALLLCACAQAEELPLETLSEEASANLFVSNPRKLRDIGDPFVLPVEGGYDVFATGGVMGFSVWQSQELATFDKAKALKKVAWASGDYWAPEVVAYGGKYVMLYTARWSENESLRMGIAFADAPEGPYEDPLGAPLFDFGYAAIDGTLVVTPEGVPYLIYSRDCSENVVEDRHESHLYGVRLAEDLLSTVGDAVLLTAPTLSWETLSGDYRWNEGPAVVQHDGRYYLYYSTNYYAAKEYSVGVAVSDSPLGPYVKQEQPILTWIEQADGTVTVSGPGHNSFFTVGDELFTAYHTHTYPLAPSGNRQLCVDRAGFHADGTAYISGPTLAPQLRPLAELGLTDHAKTAVDVDPLLTDGDACIAPSSAPYAWHGTQADFTWASPVKAEGVLITPVYGEALSGRIVLNGTMSAPFSMGADQQPGQSVWLAFAETEVTQMQVIFDEEAAVGEIRILGQ